MDKLFLSLHHSLLEVDIHQIVDDFSSFLYFQLKCDKKWMMRRWSAVWEVLSPGLAGDSREHREVGEHSLAALELLHQGEVSGTWPESNNEENLTPEIPLNSSASGRCEC